MLYSSQPEISNRHVLEGPTQECMCWEGFCWLSYAVEGCLPSGIGSVEEEKGQMGDGEKG